MEFTQKQIEEKFEALPRDMQNAISDKEVTATLRAIGERHKLRLDSIGFLIEETGLIMLGLVQTDQYIERLAKKLEVAKEDAESMVADIDEKIFRKVRDSLRQVQYKGTVDKRFIEVPDFPTKNTEGNVPERDALLQELEIEGAKETPGIEAIQQAAPTYTATADYNPEEFGEENIANVASLEQGNIVPTETTYTSTEASSAVVPPVAEPTVSSTVAPTVPSVTSSLGVERPAEETDNVFNFEKEKKNENETEVEAQKIEVNVSFQDKLQQKIAEQKQTTSSDSYREPIG